MDCLMKFKWVKLRRDCLPTGKGIMGYWTKLSSRVAFRKQTRNEVYSIQAEEWEKDKIWEYMNGFEFLYVLAGMARRRKK